MNRVAERARNLLPGRRGGAILAALFFLWSATNAHAGQAQGEFRVAVNLQASALCRTTSFAGLAGFGVTVVCATGTVAGMPWSPMYGGAYYYDTGTSRYETVGGAAAGMLFGADDMIETGFGTATSMRMVTLANRDYLEITVTW